MEISVSQSALQWLKSELRIHQGDTVRLFVKYGGSGGPTPGFSLGIIQQTPKEIGLKAIVDGITFFIEEQDLWFLDSHSVFVETNELDGDLEFVYPA